MSFTDEMSIEVGGAMGIVEMGIKGSVKSPHLPSRYPQPQPKKNLIAYRRLLDSLLELHSTVSFSNLKHCERRR